MADVIGDLLVRISADTKALMAGLDHSSRVTKKFGEELTSLGSRLSLSVSAPLIGVGIAAIKAAGDMESAKIGFTTLLHSGEKAGAMLRDLKDFAVKTPFTFPDLVTGAQRMIAMGFAAKDTIPNLTAIGNATAALGAGPEVLNRITLALGQMRNSAKVSAQDMNQLTQAGIDGWGILAKHAGVSIGTIRETAKDIFTGAEASAIIMKGLAENFSGGMEAQSKSIKGMFSNVQDAVMFTLADVGNALLPFGKDFIANNLMPMLDGVKSLARGFAELDPPVQKSIIGVGAFAAALPLVVTGLGVAITQFGIVSTAITRLTSLIGISKLALLGLVGGLTAVIGALGIVGVEFNRFISNADRVRDTNKSLADSYGVVGLAAAGIVAMTKALWDASSMNAQDRMQQKISGNYDYMIGRLKELAAVGTPAMAAQAMQLAHATAATDSLKGATGKLEASTRKLFEVYKAIPFGEKTAQGALAVAMYEDLVRQHDKLRDSIIELRKAGTMEIPEPPAIQFETPTIKPPVWAKSTGAEDLTRSVGDLDDAYKTLGVTMRRTTDVDTARAAYGKIVDAYKRGEKGQADLQHGAEALARIEREARGELKAKTVTMSEFGREAERVMRQLSRGIADAIVHAKSIGDVFKKVGQEIAEAILSFAINKGIKLLLKSLDDVIDKASGLGKILGTVFGSGGSAASGAAGTAGSGAGKAAGGVASTGTSAGGAAGQAAGSGLAATVSAITGVATAISSIVGNFQMAGMNKSLDLIEHETRYSQIHLFNILDKLNQYIPNLKDIHSYLYTHQIQALAEINNSIQAMRNVNLSGLTIDAKALSFGRLEEIAMSGVDWLQTINRSIGGLSLAPELSFAGIPSVGGGDVFNFSGDIVVNGASDPEKFAKELTRLANLRRGR